MAVHLGRGPWNPGTEVVDVTRSLPPAVDMRSLQYSANIARRRPVRAIAQRTFFSLAIVLMSVTVVPAAA
jgi:hypothetical protein